VLIATAALVVCALPGLAQERPVVGPERPFQLAPRVERTLPNGLRVIVTRQTAIPKVSITLTVLSGYSSDPVDLTGLASLTADLIQEGTKTKSSRQIRRDVFGMGGSLTASASQDFTSVSVRGLSEFAPRLVDLVADVAMNPTIPEDEVAILKQQHLQNLLAQEIPDPPLRTSLLIWCSLFFALAVCLQMTLAPEVERLLIILVFLPNVVMAYAFGWQGGVLAAILGSLMITVTRQMSGAFHDLLELELFLSTQALLGIGLGIAISRQQQLASHLNRYRLQLEQELHTRRQLTERLVHTEEAVRKEIARELHDEIGQNITAIQIQAMLVDRSPHGEATHAAAKQIGELSQRIHHTTRQLLRQLRPPVLDEMALDKALHHLASEFAFAQQGIDFQLDYRLPGVPTDDTLIFTLYRLVQELLNNINKHAGATEVRVSLTEQHPMLVLDVCDNGIGFTQPVQEGFGLRGIEERVRALGGEWVLSQQAGTRIIVKLPTNLQRTPP